MRANILYILMAVGVLASCKDYADTEVEATYLSGTSKTPIAVKTNLSAAPVSRAFDKTFENGDKLFAYIEAGKMVDGVFDATTSTFKWADNFSLTRGVTTSTDEGKGNITSTTEDSDLSPIIYWDDFSSTDYDLREDGRGIRLKYGYCFNGASEPADFSKEAGTLTWTVNDNQSAASDIKKSDLLYAKTQEMIGYVHNPNDRGTLVLPYTHAMSKVTINITAGEGFLTTTENFKEAVLTLKDMQTKASVDAPKATVVSSSAAVDIKDITTFNKTKTNITATYQAIIAPTHLSAGNLLAAVTNIDGNNYEIPLTDGILDAWKAESKLIASDEVIYNGVAQTKPASRASITPGSGYITKPGIHYILDVTVEKQKITIRATITDWDSVKATGLSAINFTGDVTTTGSIANELKANGFDVYKSNTNSGFTAKSTTVTNISDVWTYNPIIYWAGQGDASFFRAVSPAGGSTSELTQGSDLMWGTSGNTAIAPRTGDVALTFQHLMSKLRIELQTVDGDAAVDLAGATINVTNMATSATYNIVNGAVTPNAVVANMFTEGQPSGFTEFVIPQTIGDNAKIGITLADGTTYSVQLNECTLTGKTETVGTWESGKDYTYTITLSKKDITFSAVVKDWVPASGSGNATLDWD